MRPAVSMDPAIPCISWYGLLVLRVLIVEPFEDFREVLTHACTATGRVEVRSFSTLADAEEATQWFPVAALVATELLSDGRASEFRAALPSLRYVVGMTNDRSGYDDGQCNRVVVKPFNTQALLDHIEEHVRDNGK